MTTEYIDQLIEDCKAAKKVKNSRIFTMKDLSDLDGIKNAIYIFYCDDDYKNKMVKDFIKYKSKKLRACPKLNNCEETNVMYVGSSTTGLKSRIATHIGKPSTKGGTSALQLSFWFKGTYRVVVYEYGDVPRSVIQIVEDNMSNVLSPAFGKKGGNNK